MKLFRSFAIALLTCSAVLSFNSCQQLEEESSSVVLSSENAFQAVSSDATSAEFEIKSNSSWYVTSSAEWVSDYTKSGNGNGTLTVTFDANTSTEKERAASFSVISGTKSIALVVTQARVGADASEAQLSIEVRELTVDADATSVEFDVTSNTIWGVYTEDDWFNSYTTMGEGNGKLEITFDAYKNRKQDRTATFIVSARDKAITVTLTQLKTDRIEIIDTKIEKFNQAAVDAEMFYRLIGQITEISDNASGVITIKDYNSTIKVNGLLDGPKGNANNFASFNAQVGDVIYVVASRGEDAGTAVAANAYVEAYKPVQTKTVAEYIALAETTDTWYIVSGSVSELANAEAGTLTLKNPLGSETVAVNSVLTGINGEKNKFSTLYVAADDNLTILVPGKATPVEEAYYLSHKPGKYPLGELARWTFTDTDGNTPDNPTPEEILTWFGTSEAVVDTWYPRNTAGDIGYILSDDGKSKFVFVQADKTSVGQWIELGLYNTAQPGFKFLWIDDAFEFRVNPEFDVPIGTKFKFDVCPRPAAGAPGWYMVEYYAGGQWYPAGQPQQGTGDFSAYSYNMKRTKGNDDTLIEHVFTTEHDATKDEFKIRIRISAPVTAGGALMTAPSDAQLRFRGTKSGADLNPVITVVE